MVFIGAKFNQMMRGDDVRLMIKRAVPPSASGGFSLTLRNPFLFPRCIDSNFVQAASVLQIVFNVISAAELSSLGTLDQLELLEEFKVSREDLDQLDGDRFGRIERDGRVLYRFRAKDYRFYFEVKEGAVVVHRVLHKGTFSDFLFRSKMPVSEDDALANSKHFWKLIDEGRNSQPM